MLSSHSSTLQMLQMSFVTLDILTILSSTMKISLTESMIKKCFWDLAVSCEPTFYYVYFVIVYRIENPAFTNVNNKSLNFCI